MCTDRIREENDMIRRDELQHAVLASGDGIGERVMKPLRYPLSEHIFKVIKAGSGSTRYWDLSIFIYNALEYRVENRTLLFFFRF